MVTCRRLKKTKHQLVQETEEGAPANKNDWSAAKRLHHKQ